MFQQLGHLTKVALGISTKNRTFGGPLWVQVGISNRCNYRCVMCWDHPSFDEKDNLHPDNVTSKFYRDNPTADRSSALMDTALFGEIINDLYTSGTRRVDLIGRGEPFLNKDLVQMVSLIKKKNMFGSIATNGSKLTLDTLEWLIKEGLDRLIVSLNAGRPETYSKIHPTEDASGFFRIKESLIELSRLKSRLSVNRPYLTLSFVLSKKNYKEVRDMVAIAKEVGAQQVIFKPAVLYSGIRFLGLSDSQKVRLDRDVVELEKEAAKASIDMKFEPFRGISASRPVGPPPPLHVYENIPCYVGWLFALITADGTVLPCCQCYSKMGNIRHQSFNHIWCSDFYREFRRNTINLPEIKEIVPDCRCDVCEFTKFNLSLHNTLHPFHKKIFSKGQRAYRIVPLLSALISKKTVYGPKKTTGR